MFLCSSPSCFEYARFRVPFLTGHVQTLPSPLAITFASWARGHAAASNRLDVICKCMFILSRKQPGRNPSEKKEESKEKEKTNTTTRKTAHSHKLSTTTLYFSDAIVRAHAKRFLVAHGGKTARMFKQGVPISVGGMSAGTGRLVKLRLHQDHRHNTHSEHQQATTTNRKQFPSLVFMRIQTPSNN